LYNKTIRKAEIFRIQQNKNANISGMLKILTLAKLSPPPPKKKKPQSTFTPTRTHTPAPHIPHPIPTPYPYPFPLPIQSNLPLNQSLPVEAQLRGALRRSGIRGSLGGGRREHRGPIGGQIG